MLIYDPWINQYIDDAENDQITEEAYKTEYRNFN